MGHATRSEVVIGSLLERHQVRVFASGAAFRHLSERLPGRPGLRADLRPGGGPDPPLADGRPERPQRPRGAPGGSVWAEEVDAWDPDVVITDFEPVSRRFRAAQAEAADAVDNINAIDRCRHGRRIIGVEREDYLIARAVVKGMVPGAAEYLVTTFFRPPLARKRTSLVPPILRPGSPRRRAMTAITCSSTGGAMRTCRIAAQVRLISCLVYGCGAARARPGSRATSSSARPRTRASSKRCGPAAGSLPAAGSRCSARRSTWASQSSRLP